MSTQSIKWINETERNGWKVLLIGRPAGSLANKLMEIPGNCIRLSVSLHAESGLINNCDPYDCYILDADYPGDIAKTMEYILNIHRDARIIVVSDSYDWEDAVNAFRLGAINVIRTPRTGIIAKQTIKYALKQQLPRRDDSKHAGVL